MVDENVRSTGETIRSRKMVGQFGGRDAAIFRVSDRLKGERCKESTFDREKKLFVEGWCR